MTVGSEYKRCAHSYQRRLSVTDIVDGVVVVCLLFFTMVFLLYCILYCILPLYFVSVSMSWDSLKCYVTTNESAEVTKQTPADPLSNFTHRIGLITDLNKGSNVHNRLYSGYFKQGQLKYDPTYKTVTVEWDREKGNKTFRSKMSMDGQGHLVALVAYDGKLLTVDGHTGVVYAIEDDKLEPWLILFDGDERQKGIENEWATVKDSRLYVGSHGEVWNIDDQGPVWVKVVDKDGGMKRLNWTNNYIKVREAFNEHFPGHMVHELCVWSDVHGRWYFLPRTTFIDRSDGQRATTVMVSATPHFDDIQVVRVGETVPEYMDIFNYYNQHSHGFSSFKFVPGTSDRIIAAIKTLEIGGFVETFITAFTVEGEIILPETKVPDMDFEAFEFI